jgi:outer membrane protein
MKKFLTAVLFTSVAVLAFSTTKAQSKYGYISTDELISVMPETKKADSNLTQYRTALVQNAQDKEANLQSSIEKFNKDSATMSGPVKEVKRTELQKMLNDLQSEDQRIQQQLRQRQEELLGPINKKAFDAIQAVAKESGYTYVFEKQAILVAPPGDDVLPLVAKKLNIKLPAKGAAGAQRAPAAADK